MPGKARPAKSWDLTMRESPESINRAGGEPYATALHPVAQEAQSQTFYALNKLGSCLIPRCQTRPSAARHEGMWRKGEMVRSAELPQGSLEPVKTFCGTTRHCPKPSHAVSVTEAPGECSVGKHQLLEEGHLLQGQSCGIVLSLSYKAF